ncbi:DUF418 domain-containing protein [Rothia terrae]|uniref:DUF418 domain-containing protein n=1 Tax=Rothia terrae TaxID=396015 RepID=A0A7H2BDJ3_9MICC|nr:DUF418 domain-containing protein [Rothia terrae]QNV37739.1 DUF418 domain-containing protein [Rothia terrae]
MTSPAPLNISADQSVASADSSPASGKSSPAPGTAPVSALDAPPAPAPSTASTASASALSIPRMVVPDVARGLMLLGIAIANIATVWLVMPGAPGGDLGGIVRDSLWDKLTILFTAVFVHARGFPMFATMMGFGVGMIAASLYRRGYPLGKARGVIACRYGMLAIFGVVHMVFLFWGDIMMMYGLMGMLLATMIAMHTRTLLIIAGVLFVLGTLGSVGLAVFVDFTDIGRQLMGDPTATADAFTSSTYLGSVGFGALALVMQVVSSPFQLPALLPLVLFGFVMAREGLLSDTAHHRRTLVRVAVVGMGCGVVTGVLYGLSLVGVLPAWELFSSVSMSVGTLAGPGLIAVLALVLAPVQQRVAKAAEAGKPAALPQPLTVLAALGKRSMTGYVLQSVLCIIFLAPYGLHLFADAGAFVALWAGVGVWLVTLVVANVLEVFGKPGPLEAVHRRLSYGKSGLMSSWQPR